MHDQHGVKNCRSNEFVITIWGKFSLPPKVSRVFQFKLKSFKIGSLPPEISKSDNLNLLSTFSVKLDGKL
jgi:hypothetical protein